MIYCVWYPSGGFGHFINAILNLHGKDFARPINKITFSNTGNLHSLDLPAPKYCADPENYDFEFDQTLNYSVLIDNGINNEGERFKKIFPKAHIIKLCYNDVSWPIVAKTMIDKAMQSNVNEQLLVNCDKWNVDESWVVREKYFLFLRDHALRKAWRPGNDVINLLINDMLDYTQLHRQLSSLGVELNDFKLFHRAWQQANAQYIDPVKNSQLVVESIKNNVNISLDHFSDIWDQAVLYYFLWINFGQEVPHNDFADFFSDAAAVKKCLKLLIC
jgi:hypothetical protein